MRKKLDIILVFLFATSINCFSAISVVNGDSLKIKEVSGIYKERNLFFYTPSCKSPSSDERVIVKFKNNVIFEASKTKAFEVDLLDQNLTYGEEIKIQLFYNGCKPFIVNDEAIEKRNSFKISDLHVSDTGLIVFKTFNEIDKFPFIVQQYKWNSWVKVDKIDGEGGENWKEYNTVVSIISGENKFRVIRYNLWKPLTKSEEFTFTSKKSQPTVEYDKKSGKVMFSESTSFVLKNEFGENLLEGTSDQIDLSSFSKGIYIIAFDNTYIDITK